MRSRSTNAYLRSVEYLRHEIPDGKEYPFHLPLFQHFENIEFHPKVTYLVGENGTGKSTLLEAIAIALGFNPEGGTINFSFSTYESHSDLHKYIKLVRGMTKPKDGFFFRAESYYNVATNIEELDAIPGPGRPIIDSYGGKSLHKQSHGESFFATFVHRLGGNGLYILDEPEAALSPFRQMAMLSRIHSLVGQNSQFIISTHSPILMAYPDSVIYYLTSDGLEERTLESTDHFVIMREFLNNKERILGELLAEDDE